jgi:hypothetical protein
MPDPSVVIPDSVQDPMFRPQVKFDLDLRGQTPGLDTKNIPVRALLATVR